MLLAVDCNCIGYHYTSTGNIHDHETHLQWHVIVRTSFTTTKEESWIDTKHPTKSPV